MKMNIPNYLTILRVFMVPIFVVFMLADIFGAAFILFIHGL